MNKGVIYMNNFMLTKWIENQENNIRLRKAEIASLEALLKRIEQPATDKKNAINKLNLLMKICELNPQYGAFPTLEIMKELLGDQSYGIKEFPDGRYSFVVDAFELELIPNESALKVKNINNTLTPTKPNKDITGWKYRISEEYDIVLRLGSKMISNMEAAKELAQLSLDYEVLNPSKLKLFFRTIKNYFSLKYSNKDVEISIAWQEENKRKEEIHQEQEEELYECLVQEFQTMKISGLYDTLSLIEKESDCFVSFDIFTDNYIWPNGMKAVDAFLNKYGKDVI